MDLDDIFQDIAAFADDEKDVIIEKGMAVFQRNRQTYECRLFETASGIEVAFNGTTLPYSRFLGEELGRLTILAEAIRQKRKDVEPYIDTKAVITDALDKKSNVTSAIAAVSTECQSRPLGETKLIFLTADAGHGKTALLRRLTQDFAQRYLAHKTGMLLLHVDTQGRSFIRLEEAVAGDLGQLRISGLFYSGVIRLIRRGLLAIAIDGFDELLAEIGFSEAYSGLGAFLRQLSGNGVVIASARSAYFEVENYTAQTRLLNSLANTHVTTQLLRLEPWGREESTQYFTQYRSEKNEAIREPDKLYDVLSGRLGENHPVLHRPFLVHKMASLIASDSTVLNQLAVEVGTSTLKVVPNVIQALLKREVEEKWRDPNGQPYLSLEQHTILLAAVADEMWIQGKTSLPTEVIQLIADAVSDTLGIPQTRRVQVVQRSSAHALLPPNPTNPAESAFDHEEFLNYFLAMRLVYLFKANDWFGVQRFCEIRSLPLIVGIWAANIESWSSQQVKSVVDGFDKLTTAELRSTYLKQNAGLLSSQLAKYHGTDRSGYHFDSMYFEGEELKGLDLRASRFRRCTFNGVDISDASLVNCEIVECQIDSLTCNPTTILTGTTFDSATQIAGVLELGEEGDMGMRSYVPADCQRILTRHGASFPGGVQHEQLKPVPKDKRQVLDTFLRIFSRNSGATENVMKIKLGSRIGLFRSKVLPALLTHRVIVLTEYSGRGQPQERYELNYPVEIILRAEDPRAPSIPNELRVFWEELRK